MHTSGMQEILELRLGNNSPSFADAELSSLPFFLLLSEQHAVKIETRSYVGCKTDHFSRRPNRIGGNSAESSRICGGFISKVQSNVFLSLLPY